jgi:hypothetical protein
MNRPRLVLLAFLTLALGAAPAPLVVGTVRDQHGAPIAGAQVRLIGSLLGSAAATVTANDGTFAIAGSATSIEIRCAYCRTTQVPVASDGTAIAVVQRYDAVRLQGPSADDLSHLPYTHAESELALTPFAVLEENANPLVGSSLHDRSISTPGGLLVLDGVPDYDNATGTTTLDTIPYDQAASADVEPASKAYEYGGVANGGTFSVNTLGGTSSIASGAGTSVALSSADAAAGYSASDDDRRARATAEVSLPAPDTAVQVSLSSGEGDVTGNDANTLQSAFSSLNVSAERTTGTDAYAQFIADRGSSAFTSPDYDASDVWSNIEALAGVRSHSVIAPFAQIEERQSTGWFWTPAEAPYIAGTLGEQRAYGGISADLPWYSASVVYGLDAVRFVETYPSLPASSVTGHDAAASIDLHPQGAWDLAASASSGYLLQTTFGYYEANEGGYAPLDEQSSDEVDLTYRDLHRIRIGLTAFTTRTASGIDDTSSGAELAWQIAPAVSLRTWWLQVHPHTGSPQSVGSAWLTAQSGAIRFDAIWQRDLYDLAGDGHLDGSIWGPLSPRIGWFVRSERFARRRSASAGLTF